MVNRQQLLIVYLKLNNIKINLMTFILLIQLYIICNHLDVLFHTSQVIIYNIKSIKRNNNSKKSTRNYVYS